MPRLVSVRALIDCCHVASPLRILVVMTTLLTLAAGWVRQLPPFRDSPLTASASDDAGEAVPADRVPLYGLSISNDERCVALRAFDRPAVVYATATGEPLCCFDQSWDVDASIEISPDGSIAALGRYDGTVLLAEFMAGAEPEPTVLKAPGYANRISITTMAFSPDSRRLATAGLSNNENVRVWDVQSGRLVRRLRCSGAGVRRLCYSPDGARVAAALGDGRAAVWDVASGQARLFDDPARAIMDVRFLPETSSIVTCGHDGRVWRWKVNESPSDPVLLFSCGRPLLHMDLSGDGRLAAFGSQCGRIICFSVPSREILVEWHGDVSRPVALEFSADGRRLYSAGHDGLLTTWSLESFLQVEQWRAGADVRLRRVDAG